MVARKVYIPKNGGARPNSGFKTGSMTEMRSVAIAQARRTHSGKLPDELLREWGETGVMKYPSRPGVSARCVTLDPALRVNCLRASAPYFKAPMKMPGEEKPTIITLSEDFLTALLASGNVDVLSELRSLFLSVQSGRVIDGEAEDVDADLYEASLSPAPKQINGSRNGSGE